MNEELDTFIASVGSRLTIVVASRCYGDVSQFLAFDLICWWRRSEAGGLFVRGSCLLNDQYPSGSQPMMVRLLTSETRRGGVVQLSLLSLY